MLTKNKEQLAVELLNIGAIKFGNFRLKLHEKNPDAPLSPIYIDLRLLRSFPDVIDSTVFVYRDLSKDFLFDVYADVPTAATPIVAILSHTTRIPMISPRKEEKKHGTKTPIDGVFAVGQKVLLIDDLITNAASKVETISILEENGLSVSGVAVLIDREQGGKAELEKNGYACRAAFRLTDVLKFYSMKGLISQEDYRRTMDYLQL
jgi:orotate phosphoribosyltransferase